MIVTRAMLEDAKFLFELRNEPEVRAVSWNREPLAWDNHIMWFRKSLANLNRSFFVLRSDSGEPVGQVRYDVSGEIAEVSVSVSNRFYGKGYASNGLKKSVKVFFESFPKVLVIFAHIMSDNIASIRTFEKAGYKDKKMVNFEGHECVEMILNRP